MDIKSESIEKACKAFKNHVSEFNVNHVSVSSLNLETNELNCVCSNYDWHLEYWGTGLYKRYGKRCEPGVRYWNELDSEHSRILFESTESQLKVDFTTRHGQFIEIFSIGMNDKNARVEMCDIIRHKPRVSNLLYLISKEYDIDKIQVPREPTANLINQNKAYIGGKHFNFGDIRFTEKEMQTITLILQLRSIKEICAFHKCNRAAETKRINNIKKKLGCEGSGLSKLYDHLNHYGVTLSCAISSLDYPIRTNF
ncbi:hypothetical protein [Vibrio marisflavi]|uniref:Uncharacterized protein n=1 Tax=Vibrio marisflavi CECT 7928 TaxID=634439 RepID=A0ABM9A9C7_9VIBR|nr:hypothetical protein [Vibrio marisflavi]CAH0543112.1 hypothetical protein VMF7928_04406 [Vibrio marisflavi CECT 7928]